MIRSAQSCPECGHELESAAHGPERLEPCPGCGREVWHRMFPAARLPRFSDGAPQVHTRPGGAVCFDHPDQPAEGSCMRCGRFICQSCALPVKRGLLCPSCLDKDLHEGDLKILQRGVSRVDKISFLISLIPFFITGILAVVMVLVFWKRQAQIPGAGKGWFVAAFMLGSLQILALIMLTLLLFRAFN